MGFTLIVGGNSEAAIATVLAACTVMQMGYAVALVAFVVQLLSQLHMASARRLLLEVVAVNLLYYVAPPLLAFTIYFNLYHSQRHVVRVMQMRTWQASFRDTLVVGVAFTMLFTTILGVWYYLGQVSTSGMMKDASPLVRPMFIVISVMTVPHMVLVNDVLTHGGDRLQGKMVEHDDEVRGRTKEVRDDNRLDSALHVV